MSALELTIAACLLAVVLTYAGYPVFVVLAGHFAPVHKASGQPCAIDKVSIIICAHNEAGVIKRKLLSVLGASAKTEFEVIIGDDGSTDATTARAMEVDDPRVRVLQFSRMGKSETLDRLVAEAEGDILVFSDADTLWREDTLEELLHPFSDPQIGAAAGVIETIKGTAKLSSGDTVYRKYENAVRRAEAKLFGAVSADGGLYAIRREHYQKAVPGATDDFFISTGAVANGRRIAFARRAVAYEESIPTIAGHFRRRVRITVRGLASVWSRRQLLNPFRFGFYAIGLFFHKVARRLAPVFLLAACVLLAIAGISNAALRPLIMLLAFAAGAAIAFTVFDWPKSRIVKLPGYALIHLSGLAAGVCLFCLGVRYVQWTPADAARSEDGS